MVEAYEVFLGCKTQKRQREIRGTMVAAWISRVRDNVAYHSVAHGFLKTFGKVSENYVSKLGKGSPSFIGDSGEVLGRGIGLDSHKDLNFLICVLQNKQL